MSARYVKYRVGDKVQAVVWKGQPDKSEHHTVIGKVHYFDPHDAKKIYLVVENPPYPTLSETWVYDEKPAVLSYRSGYIVGPPPVEVQQPKKTISPFMDNPYSKGPEGETLGPSGLIFL